MYEGRSARWHYKERDRCLKRLRWHPSAHESTRKFWLSEARRHHHLGQFLRHGIVHKGFKIRYKGVEYKHKEN